MVLEDILTYNRDMQELKLQEKEEKRKQVESNKRKAEEIRKAAMKGRASKSLLSKHTIRVIFLQTMFPSQFHCYFLLTISENSDTSSDSENEFNNESDSDNYDKERVPKKDKGRKGKGKNGECQS